MQRKKQKKFLKEQGKPIYERTLEAVDNPYIKRATGLKAVQELWKVIIPLSESNMTASMEQ